MNDEKISTESKQECYQDLEPGYPKKSEPVSETITVETSVPGFGSSISYNTTGGFYNPNWVNSVYVPPIDWNEVQLREKAIEKTTMLFGTAQVDFITFSNVLDQVYNYLKYGTPMNFQAVADALLKDSGIEDAF